MRGDNMKQIQTKLFGKSKNNKFKQWSVYVDGADVIAEYGYVDGKLQQQRYTATAKNIGKANQTTPETQAIIEANALYVYQIDRKQYRPTIDDLSHIAVRLPMLAHDYLKHQKKVKYKSYVQRKYDGVRSIFDDSIFISRKGIEYILPEVLYLEMNILSERLDIPFDGELYVHGMYLQQINALVKNKKNTDRHKLKYIIFDIPIENQTFEERIMLLNRTAELIKELNLVHVEVAPIEVVHNLQELEDLQIQYINEGYEGIMIRNPEGLYLYDHRSHDLLKYKNFKEKEFLILDVTPDKDGQGVFVCDCGDDNTFGCRMRGTDEYRVELLQNKDNYIGSWVTVRYQSTTQKGIPTFGTGVNIRLCNNGKAIE